MLYLWLFLLFVGTWGTGLNIIEGNEGFISIPLQLAFCLGYFCMFIRSVIREGTSRMACKCLEVASD